MTSKDLFPINFPKFLRNVPFVKRRKKTAFTVRYLSDLSTKSFLIIHVIVFNLNLKSRYRVGPILLHFTFKDIVRDAFKIDGYSFPKSLSRDCLSVHA